MRKIFASFLVVLVSLFVFSVGRVSAKMIANESGAVNVGKTEVINDDLFIGAQTVEIAGTVNGDVFIGAQTVKISGIINGSLHIGANTIDLGGKISGNVYAGGQSILLNGSTIGGSVMFGGATVNIDKASSIGGSVMAGAGAISIDSNVKRSVYAGAGSITIGDSARIGKDLYYSSGDVQNGAKISTSAKILGNVYKSEVKPTQTNMDLDSIKKQAPAMLSVAKMVATLISFAGALIVGLLYFKLFNKHFTQSAGMVSKSLWKCFGIGFLVTIAFLPGLILLLITIIGIPVAGLGLLMFSLYSYLAKIVVGLAFGNWITGKFKWKVSAFWAFAIGLFVLEILKIIPIGGFIVGLIILWLGLGALTLKIFSTD